LTKKNAILSMIGYYLKDTKPMTGHNS